MVCAENRVRAENALWDQSEGHKRDLRGKGCCLCKDDDNLAQYLVTSAKRLLCVKTFVAPWLLKLLIPLKKLKQTPKYRSHPVALTSIYLLF